MSDTEPQLFGADGALDLTAFEPGAQQTLRRCEVWVREVGRSVFLPIDLLVVMLGRDHVELDRVVSGARPGDADPVASLRELARRVERENLGVASLAVDHFSLGFTGILTDALQWARESGRVRVSDNDLARVMRWRAELQESASVRWALKQLGQAGTEALFEHDGELRRWAFSVGMWTVFRDAMRLSARGGLGFLGTPHLMAALVDYGGLLATACGEVGLRPRRLRDELVGIVGERRPALPEFALSRQSLTPRLVRMLVSAAQAAAARGLPVGELEIVEAFLVDGGSSLDVVASLALVEPLKRAIAEAPARVAEPGPRVAVMEAGRAPSGAAASATPTLDELGRDLTADARAGKLGRVLGRDAELERVVNVLLRTEQRNPLLTGSAGVGKTALASALAQRIAEGAVPERLTNMRVVEINGASLIGGTSYRGELEARIQALLAECERDVVLFIDEAHAVFAPRSSSGQPAEVPNHFKAALASGKIAVIAATTDAEYRRWIEEDPALRRRFERIVVEELSPQLTRSILAELAPVYERTYQVPVTPDAVDAAIELSARFMPEQALPDKAKKLLMDATIAVASSVALQRATRRAAAAAAGEPDVEVAAGHEAATERGTPSQRVVTRLDVARQVAQKTGVPLERVARGGVDWWVGLEDRLGAHVAGQERAVRQVAHRLVEGALRNAGRKRPQAALLLIGPPGVGIREAVAGMAREIFGQKDALLQLEMSDFADAHAISRLVGSPPGYVGYHDEDALVTPLRRSPSRLVLLQDFNRAHPRVQDRIFRMFEEGEVADTRGLKADVSHAIFVLTVEQEAVGAASIGFGRATTPTGDDVLRRTDPDLAQRLRGREIDVIRFDGLRDDDGDLAEKLVRRRLAEFRAALGEAYDVELVIAAPIEDDLLGRVRALDDARGIDAVLRELIIAPVTAQLLAGGSGTTLTLGTLPMRPLTSTESAAYPSASTTRPPEDDPAEKEHV